MGARKVGAELLLSKVTLVHFLAQVLFGRMDKLSPIRLFSQSPVNLAACLRERSGSNSPNQRSIADTQCS